MVEFATEYYTPMDRAYHERIELDAPRPSESIEQPIIPLSHLGQTVPEHDPTGRFKNILQNVQAAIRAGTGNLQLVFQTPIESALGGRPKAYGEEVRQALKEVALANEAAITGFEMPTSLNNLAGWDIQQNRLSEEKRQRDLDEVKEMIRFAAEVGQGGGVDIVSWEYDRPLHRAEWLQEDPVARKAFAAAIKEEEKHEDIKFVDTRSGQIFPIPIREGIPVFMDKKTFERTDPTKPGTVPQLWKYDDFKRLAEHDNKDVHDVIKEHFFKEQEDMAHGQVAYYKRFYDSAVEELKEIQNLLKKEQAPDKVQRLRESESNLRTQIEDFASTIKRQKGIILQNEELRKNMELLERESVRRSVQSYAEAGITAMQTQDKLARNIRKDLYVGPEIGWPQYYGSHPTEFANMILTARKRMVDILTDPRQCAAYGIRKPMNLAQAEQEARTHVKGTFDTSHVGMWLQQFHPELPWKQRLDKFTAWYTDQVEKLAEINKREDIIGAVQAVDSAGAGHGHLPPGQGILPVRKAVEILKEKGGFNGYVTSEGHEEEKFGEGRILLKTWQEFNSPFQRGYAAAPGIAPRRWGDVQQAYFGRTYSPLLMFGAYAPSNEFKLWSEVPLE